MNEIDEIRKQMAQIRRDLHQDVSEVVEEAESALNWRSYIRSYPWVAVGLTVAVGYFIIPRKKAPRTTVVIAPPREVMQAVSDDSDMPQPVAAPKRRGWGLGSIFTGSISILWPIAMRAAQSYAANWIESMLVQQQYDAPNSPVPPRPPGQPGSSFSDSSQEARRGPMF